MNKYEKLSKKMEAMIIRVFGIILGIGMFMVGVTGTFSFFLTNLLCIVSGIAAISVSIWLFIKKDDFKEIDKEDQQQKDKTAFAQEKQNEITKQIRERQIAILSSEKSVKFTIETGIMGNYVAQVWLNDKMIGELNPKSLELIFPVAYAKNYLHLVWINTKKNTQRKSECCVFSVDSLDGIGYIALFGDKFLIRPDSANGITDISTLNG